MICPYFSGRRWNLERHYENVHGQNMNAQLMGIRQNSRTVKKERINYNNVGDSPRSDSQDWSQSLEELAKIQNTVANSRQTFANSRQTLDRLNFFETKANTLENQLHGIYKHYWIIPRFHVQGLNGHICNLCKTFSYKVVMDLGYDLTMKFKHNCFEQIGAFTCPIPPEVEDTDRWAAGLLFEQMSYFESIGNRLVLNDLTNLFTVYRGYEYRDLILGIPDRHPMTSLDDKYIVDLIDKTWKSPGQRKLMLDSQIIDLLTKTKSTFGILKVPNQEDYKYLYMKIVK